MPANFENDPEFMDAVPKTKPQQQGITAKRILVSLSIFVLQIFVKLGILAFIFAIVFLFLIRPAYDAAREAARSIACANNLKQIALALRNYEQEYKALPPAYTVDANGQPLHSWRTLLLPYLDQEAIYKSIDLAKPWNDPSNAKALEAAPSVFRCPSPPWLDKNTTTYLAIVAPDGCFLPGKPRPLAEITDPHDKTLMVIEAGHENAVPWMAPRDASEFLVMSLGPSTELHHPGGMNGAFVDGSVKFLKANTPAEVRQAWISISGNNSDVIKK